MLVPDTHQSAILAMLMAAEEMAYVVLDKHLELAFVSPGANDYGIPPHGKLSGAPGWLSALTPRLARLFEYPAQLFQAALDEQQRPITIQAQVTTTEGMPCLLILLRRPVGRTPADCLTEPYHPATGLYSAAFMEHKIDEELARLKRYPAVFSLLAIHRVHPPESLSQWADALRIHFRAADILGHTAHGDFLVLLPGTGLEQARQAGERLQTLVTDFRLSLPGTATLRYTAIEASATDTRGSLFARLAEPIHS